MKQVNKLVQLKNLNYFNSTALTQITKNRPTSLYKNTSRWLKQNKLVQLKKGLYTTTAYLDKIEDITAYTEFIANQLKKPSYLSLEYVLSKYQVLSESVFAFTSVTLKKTNTYNNNLGYFIYQTITPKLFTGFTIKNISGYQVAEATKAKALFDYLYLKLYRKTLIDQELIDSFRLNLDEFNKKEIKEFSKYCKQVKIEKYKQLPKLLFG